MTFKRKESGFSLIEVLVSLFIIAISVAGMVQLQRVFMLSSQQVTQRLDAYDIAQQQVIDLHSQGPLAQQHGTKHIVRNGLQYALGWQITTESGDKKRISLAINWEFREQSQTLALEVWSHFFAYSNVYGYY